MLLVTIFLHLAYKVSKAFLNSIAFLTPYDGGNFGDAAIQDALISNFRKLIPDVQIYGITLAPTKTSAKHKITCYPLAVVGRPHYYPDLTNALAESSPVTPSLSLEPARSSAKFRLRRILRNLPLAKSVVNSLREARHIFKSYFFLRKIGVLAVAGGGQLDEEWGGAWGHPYALYKWTLLAKLAGCDIVFLSVGACSMESKLSKFFLKRSLSRATYRSYRDAGSQSLALALTPHAEGKIVPDIAFSLAINKKTQSLKQNMQVGIGPIAFAHPDLWPSGNVALHETYLNQLALFIRDLLQKGISITLFSSSSPDEKIFQGLHDRVVQDLPSELSMSLSIKEVDNHVDLLALLGSFNFVVASRLHALLLSFLLGKPCVALCYDRKVTALMNDMGQAAYCLDIRSFRSSELVASFKKLQGAALAISAELLSICNKNDNQLRVQYEKVADLLRGSNRRSSYNLQPEKPLSELHRDSSQMEVH